MSCGTETLSPGMLGHGELEGEAYVVPHLRCYRPWRASASAVFLLDTGSSRLFWLQEWCTPGGWAAKEASAMATRSARMLPSKFRRLQGTACSQLPAVVPTSFP